MQMDTSSHAHTPNKQVEVATLCNRMANALDRIAAAGCKVLNDIPPYAAFWVQQQQSRLPAHLHQRTPNDARFVVSDDKTKVRSRLTYVAPCSPPLFLSPRSVILRKDLTTLTFIAVALRRTRRPHCTCKPVRFDLRVELNFFPHSFPFPASLSLLLWRVSLERSVQVVTDGCLNWYLGKWKYKFAGVCNNVDGNR